MGDLGELFHLGIPWWHLVIRAALIYVIFFIGLRLFGKRELGQFTTFDLVLVLLVANALQPAMTGPDSSITGGVVIVALVKQNLDKEGLSVDDVEMAVREHGLDKMSDVGLAVLENDGSISVVGKGSAERFRRRRRVRFLKR
ncbi:MAG: DUF421 domain-containing protein [Chloroflexi bacterium]|nr:MAG: DUF421 domain-containing protein [Chloroflexota bacterium]